MIGGLLSWLGLRTAAPAPKGFVKVTIEPLTPFPPAPPPPARRPVDIYAPDRECTCESCVKFFERNPQ